MDRLGYRRTYNRLRDRVLIMQFTPEQQQLIQKARASGKQRVMLKFTEVQKEEWLDAVKLELAGKDENIAHFRKLKAAIEQPGLFGDIRRAIQRSGLSLGDLSAVVGGDPKTLSAFLSADKELPAAMLDRLVEALGLRLMQEIPR